MPPDLGGRQISASRSDSLDLKDSLAQRLVDRACTPREGVRDISQDAESAMVALVRCRQVDWSPSAVVALASSVDGTAVATARESGDIEIWNAAPGSVGWSCELRIPGRDNTTISSLIWSPSLEGSRRGRLFSGDLEGHVIEWDLGSLRPKAVADSHGGSVWSLAMEPTPILPPRPSLQRSSPNGEVDSSDESSSDSDSESDSETDDGRPPLRDEEILAVGCDDGCVRLFSIYSGEAGAQYRRSLPHVDGRILSLAWSMGPNSRLFAGTSDGCIRCWDMTTLREMYRITVTVGGQKTEDLCVWALLALRDGTLVSGDGSGSTQFWESKYGTLLQAHRRHSADVLSLAATPSQHGVFSAGVDGQIVMFQRTFEETPAAAGASTQRQPTGGPEGQWVFAGTRRCHTHDIRALAVATLPWEDELVVEMKGAEKRKRKRQVGRIVDTNKWALPGAAMLVSGGDDARLITYPANAFLSYMPHSISHTPNPPAIHLANGAVPCGGALMLSQQSQWMDVWHLQERRRASLVQMTTDVGGKAGKGSKSTVASADTVGTSGLKLESSPNANGVKPSKLKKGAQSPGIVEVVPAKKLKKAGVEAAGLGNGNGVHATVDQVITSRGEGAGTSGSTTATFEVPKLVARIKLKAKKRHVACSAISPDGRYVACSDTIKCRLFEIALPSKKEASAQGKASIDGWQVSRRLLPDDLGSAHCLLFNADSARLLVASRDGGIAVVNVEHGTMEHTFPPYCPNLRDDSYCSSGAAPAVTHMCASSDGQWLAAVDACGHISVFNMEALRHHWSVPRLDDSRPTAVAFHPSASGALVVASSRNRVHVLDVEACGLSEWSRTNADRLPRCLLEMAGGITGLAMPPSPSTNSIIVYNSRSMCHIDLSKPAELEQPPVSDSPPAKKSRLAIARERAQKEAMEKVGSSGAGREGVASAPSNFKIMHFEHPCLFLGFPGDGNLLLVEKPWSEVLQGFPTPIQKHKYGT